MTVYTRLKLAQISNECGATIAPATLAGYFADPRYTVTSIAAVLSTSPQWLQRAIDLPEPPADKPLNWTAVNDGTPYPYAAAWQGFTAIPYAHPLYPGFTYGAPVTRPIYF